MLAQNFIYNTLRFILDNGFKKQKRFIKDKFMTKEFPGSRILDLGCGTGSYADLFKTDRYFGLEIDKDYIRYAKQYRKRNFVLGDANCLPFKDETFGGVCAIAVFHHLPAFQVSSILKEIKRVILPKGLFLMIDQSEIKVNLFLDWFFALIRYFDKGKFIRLPKENMEILSKEPEFEIIDNCTFRNGLITYHAVLMRKE